MSVSYIEERSERRKEGRNTITPKGRRGEIAYGEF